MATGDLLVSPIPFAFFSYYEEWIATLGRLDALPADLLFLSHGYPQRDRTYLRQVQGLLGALVEETRAVAAAGLTAEQAKEKVTLPGWKATLAGGDMDFQVEVWEGSQAEAFEKALAAGAVASTSPAGVQPHTCTRVPNQLSRLGGPPATGITCTSGAPS